MDKDKVDKVDRVDKDKVDRVDKVDKVKVGKDEVDRVDKVDRNPICGSIIILSPPSTSYFLFLLLFVKMRK